MNEIPWLYELKRQATMFYVGPPREGEEREYYPVEVSSPQLLALIAIAEMAQELYDDGSNLRDMHEIINAAKGARGMP